MTNHAIERASERYGIDLTLLDLRKLEQAIIDGNSLHTTTDFNTGHQRHLVKHDGEMMLAIWQPSERIIVSFVPLDSLDAGAAYRIRAKKMKGTGKNPTRRRRKRGQHKAKNGGKFPRNKLGG